MMPPPTTIAFTAAIQATGMGRRNRIISYSLALAGVLSDDQLSLLPLPAIEIEILCRVELADPPLLRGDAQQSLDQGVLGAIALIAHEYAIVARPHRPGGMDEQQVTLLIGRTHAVADDVTAVAVAHGQQGLRPAHIVDRLVGDDNRPTAAALGR